ncbi:cytochrome c biogenesis heme-transporting ATPase CcmA [Alteromonadaceae bacterium BrNp21-10]|nr:cytochrome c biogenesis heme-transporting ATPase CcmA [Alteromonadaceae bacterium BrNp21-10]
MSVNEVDLALLVAHELTCIKSDRELFSALSFAVDAGQVLHLHGPNGAGKTSLLRILVGLSQPYGGQVLFNGQPINQHSEYNSQMIYLGHKAGLSPHLSALENLHYWQQQQAIPATVDLMNLLEKLGLVGLEEVPVGHLSAGQQRRVALARLWLKPAKLWILDEPFTALDTSAIELVQTQIEQHVKAAGSVLLTSHQALSLSIEVHNLRLDYQW